MNILYEDKYMLVCEKPADVLSEPSENGGKDILSLLKEEKGGEYFLVHRLDRNTGGAMLVAKSGEAAGKLSALIQQRDFKKEYLAVVKGEPETPEGVFEDLLFKDSQKNKSFVVKKLRKGVKEAKLEYMTLGTKTLENGEKASLVRVLLHTGRTHQIRVQFASRKMPLLGDGKYGSRDNKCETALWCERLTFVNPFTKKTVEAVSLPPKEYPWNEFDF